MLERNRSERSRPFFRFPLLSYTFRPTHNYLAKSCCCRGDDQFQNSFGQQRKRARTSGVLLQRLTYTHGSKTSWFYRAFPLKAAVATAGAKKLPTQPFTRAQKINGICSVFRMSAAKQMSMLLGEYLHVFFCLSMSSFCHPVSSFNV